MADADPVKRMGLSPLGVDKRLRQTVTEAVIAQGGFRHEQLNAFLRASLAGHATEKGALFSEPVIEGAAPYRSSGKTPADFGGGLLHPALVTALTDPGIVDDYRFTHPAYLHQLECWQLLTGQTRNSVLVSSGTGSGKTECFLIPLLDDLARQTAQSGRLTGVRALILYPLNALIASQEERLRCWTRPFAGRIRFALYNGLMQDKRKSVRDQAEEDLPEQVLYRTTLRDDPPPILVTNNTMLEYMTIRKEDQPIVEKSRGLLRWIIIDEAHSYVGSAAAELSLLLRRVLQSFAVSADQVRFVATSATIGGSDEAARAELQRYLADLAGVPLGQVHVVFGVRGRVDLPVADSASRLSEAELAEGSRFAANPAIQQLVREAEVQPVTLGRVDTYAREVGLPAQDLIEAVAHKRVLVEGRPATPLLPLRVHKFVRAVPGLWSCLSPECAGERPEEWPYGAILFQRADSCPFCEAPAFELLACRECGEPWLNAYDQGDRLTAAAVPPDEDEFAAASGREDESATSDEEGAQEEMTGLRPQAASGVRRLLAVRALAGLKQVAVDLGSGALPERRTGECAWISPGADDGACPHCHAAPTVSSSSPLLPFRFGAPFLIQNSAPIMLESVSSSPRSGVELPAKGRQLLSFTDSRQGTARFAASIETISERSYVRAFVYHMAQKAATRPIGLEEGGELEQVVKALREQVKTLPILSATLAEKEAELAGLGKVEPVPWSKAVKALSDDPMIEQWIRAVWEERDERFRKYPEAFARFLLLRELARRPRRANAVETLGFAKLVFPAIEAVSASRMPDLMKAKSRTLEEWKEFLYFLIDTSIRSRFALNISREDARWLLPRKSFLRAMVGPNEAKRTPSDLVWPTARPDGNKTNAVRLLEETLGLDSAAGEDRAVINDTLEAAWIQVRQVLEGPGSTYALDFDKSSIAPVREAWLCPVTHRVLPRLVFGRTPNGIRGNPPGARDAPARLEFPALPVTLPTTVEQYSALSTFVANDQAVANLRLTGAWGALHDRAANFSPYVRAEEHSAQQPPWRLRAFEREFKAGEINILACSTTMEMGVDIGSVEAVLNTNVPPSIANYRQRVGRAGRRSQSFASSLTLARDTPLDREAFRNPAGYLGRTLRPPRVKLDSERIVQRHANALLLAHWFKEAEGQLIRVKAGEFFGFPQGLGLEPDADPPAARFCIWLRDPSTTGRMEAPLAALTRGTALDGRPGVLEQAAEMFEQASKAFGEQWIALRDQAASVTPEARTSIEFQVKRLCREHLLGELAQRSLLPGSGFPTAVVPFVNDCKETRDHQQNASNEPEAQRNRRYDYPSRNADIAIREYAPGAEVVIDGLVWKSAGVTLNWQRPAHDANAREIQSIRTYWQCSDCLEIGCSRSRLSACPACGSERVEQSRFLEPAGFRVDWSAAPHADTDNIDFIEPEPAKISARGATWEPLLDPALGRSRSTADGLVFYFSRGSAKKGYRVCLDCGRAAEDGAKELTDHDALIPAKGGGGRCPGNDKTFAITEPLALGHEVLTDVAELQPALLADRGGAWAMASALREALSRRLGIETRELGLAAEARPGPLGQATHSLFLFDLAAGGAGYAPRLFDDLGGIIQDARDILNCPEECERACSACVLTRDLYAQQEILDRQAALALASGLLTAIAEPGEDDMAAPGAALSPPAADALARRLRSGDMIWLYAPDGFDLTVFGEPPFSLLFAQTHRVGAGARLVIPEQVFDQLDEPTRRGLRNASHRHRFEIWTGFAPPGANGAALIAVLDQPESAIGYFTRDMDARTLGDQWGVGLTHPVVEAKISSIPPAEPVPEDALERQLRSGDRVKIIGSDPGRPIRQFGAGFVGNVLKAEMEAVGGWKPGKLAELCYSDRYLKAPLPVLLMMRVLASLRDALADNGAPVPLNIVTEPLRPGHRYEHPRRLFDNWRDEDDRAETIEAIAEKLGFDMRHYEDHGAPHGRKLTVRYTDGSQVFILFDQGFGYWRSGGGDGHDFRSGPARQADALLNSSAFVAGSGESYVAVTVA